MSPSPQLAPPGSSSYSSNTLHVGDGTWDSQRDTFLLPNLVGLNFATMRYNGMGNRFLEMNGYHHLILAHGIIAAITFLGLVPIAILVNRFLTSQPFLALRIHIWFQILAFLLSTVVIALGIFAVGEKRSLTNPHHGIGIALYILIFFQVFYGGWVHRREKGKRRTHIPLKVMLHRWLGTAILLLGIVQVPLGLTLYGSPEFLFILYTLWTFALLVTYLTLSFRHERNFADHISQGSYFTETDVVEEDGRQHTRWGRLAAAGAAGAGLAALWNRRRNRSQPRTDLGPDSEDSYITEEKFEAPQRHGWGRRVLEIGAVGGGIAALRSVFKKRDRADSDVGSYRPPLGGNQAMTDGSYSAVGTGRPVTPGRHPLANPPMTPGHRHSASSLSYDYDSYLSASPSRRHHTFRDTLATAGGLAALRSLFKNRRRTKEDRRAEEIRQHEIEQERVQRANTQGQYTGDGFFPRRHRPAPSQTATSYSSLDERPGHHSGHHSGVLPALAGAGAGAAAAAALRDRDRIRPVGTDPVIAGSSGIPITDVPPPGAMHTATMATHAESSSSDPHRPGGAVAAGVAGAALGAVAADASRRRHSGRYTTDEESPSASLKVKMHNDGRHVTLRQLTEEERRKARLQKSRRRRNSSLSSASGTDGAASNVRWRRTEDRERRQAEEMKAAQPQQFRPSAAGALPPDTIAGPSTTVPQGYTLPPPPPGPPPGTYTLGGPRPPPGMHIPQPPPIPETHTPVYPPGASTVTSPGDTSDATASYANNRRRRRAERAQARLAREGRAGGNEPRVEFT